MTNDELLTVYHDAQHKAIQNIDMTIEDAHLAGLRAVLERHDYLLPEAGLTDQFVSCVRALVNGGPFDLTDSPKSLIGNLQRLLEELDKSRPQKG